RKSKSKREVALIDLQNRSEVKILEWQKARQNTSVDDTKKVKEEIIPGFETSMTETKTQIVNEMNKNKKTRAQWQNFVIQQIISAAGTIPVEKVFFSSTTLKQKASGTIPSDNIIKLISNSNKRNQRDNILKKIPKLIQKKQKYSKTNQATSANVITTNQIEDNIYTEKHP
ncbi:unnamed protein product, partial [Didymodactylos carnosus]